MLNVICKKIADKWRWHLRDFRTNIILGFALERKMWNIF